MDKKRNLTNKINKLLDLFPAVAVLGPRQCGKSTLAKNTCPNWKYYDLENLNDYQLISEDPQAFFARNDKQIILDEAHQYPDLFKTLRGVIDKKRNEKGRFLITGSSSPSLVKGLSESLAGRIATIELWPFKSNEFYERKLSPFYQLITEGPHSVKDFLDLKPILSAPELHQFWYYGGYPEPSIERLNNPAFHEMWMENYFNDYVRRDIQQLFPKININNYRRFLTILANHSGHQINISAIARALEVHSATAKDYLDIVHNTFLWRNINVFEKNTLKKIQKWSKGAFRDQGLLIHLLKIRSIDDLLLHPVAGFSFESYVTEELIRGFQSLMLTGVDYAYYRSIDKSEIDLIIDGPFGIIPIEIKLSSKVSKKMTRALEIFLQDMRLPLGILINNGEKPEIISDKLIAIPACYI